MPVGPVTRGLAGNTAKANRVQLVPLTVFIVARVHKVGAVGEPSTGQKVGITLTQQTTQHIENPSQRVGTTRQRRRFPGLQ